MASTLIMLPFLLLSLAMISSTSDAISHQTISEICSKTESPKFCRSILNSEPNVPTVNINMVDFIVLTKAQNIAADTQYVLTSLAENATQPALKRGYAECVGLYGAAFSDTHRSMQALVTNDIPTVNELVSAAKASVSGCKRAMKGVGVRDPSDLPRRNKRLDYVLSIAVVISKMI
uniref:Pectinesterase inhibitor domain-containing protein n=1 Tax=Kalanchoe fedtschenkoi TaxID=63787 RepID=A0A7N0TG33_KALFE